MDYVLKSSVSYGAGASNRIIKSGLLTAEKSIISVCKNILCTK